MELKIKNGDYIPDGLGGFVTVQGTEKLLQRALLKLTARRGVFPFMEDFGSRLWQLGRVEPTARRAAAIQYAAEALEGEPLTVTDVITADGEDGVLRLQVILQGAGGVHELGLTVR